MKKIIADFSAPRVPLFLFLFIFLPACVHMDRTKSYQVQSCTQIFYGMNFGDRIPTLNRIANAFYNQCYEEVIEYGGKAQAEFRYKTYSLTQEVSTLFIPEDVILDHVLESYERGYLTFLIMASHYKLNDPEAAQVELLRLNNEMGAEIYNYGQDPVNILFQALMWEVLNDPGEARVDWKNLGTLKNLDESILKFASKRMTAIDSGLPLNSNWKIFAVGKFPEVDWDLRFKNSDNGYFKVYGKEPFLPDCSSETGLRLSTRSWLNKIAMRHSNAYHPLVNVKSWIRLPVGITYGITTFAAGAGILIGGCSLDVYAKGDGSVCAASIQGGAALMREAPKVLRYSLKPDLRHWENIPSSFIFTTEDDLQNEACSIAPQAGHFIHQIF